MDPEVCERVVLVRGCGGLDVWVRTMAVFIDMRPLVCALLFVQIVNLRGDRGFVLHRTTRMRWYSATRIADRAGLCSQVSRGWAGKRPTRRSGSVSVVEDGIAKAIAYVNVKAARSLQIGGD